MKTLQYFSVLGQAVTTHPAIVKRISGGLRATINGWIQVFDQLITPTVGTVPLISWPIVAGTAAQPTKFNQIFDVGELSIASGLYVAFSSTDGTLTLATGSNTMDLEVELLDAEQTVTVVGDTTTTVAGLQVWSEASGAVGVTKRLYKVDYSGLVGDSSSVCLMLFAIDSPANGSTPIQEFLINGNAQVITFGKSGLRVVSETAAGVIKTGCTLKVSSTHGTLTADSDATIRAEYIQLV